MIIYSKKRVDFSKDIGNNIIEDVILNAFKKTGRSVAKNEITSWKNSLCYMHNVLLLAQTPEDAGVTIEYKIPLSSKRIDFILSGKNKEKKESIVIVELKQWKTAKRTGKDGIVSTIINGAEREMIHPSYQAWTYAKLLEDFNETVRNESIGLSPCAYLHNCISDEDVNHSFYNQYTDKAPAFLKHDAKALAGFIKKYVMYGDSREIMYRIEGGKISPSKNLADKLASLLDGNQEFVMIDEQKSVYETALYLSETSRTGQKQVLIIEGGPGTGKSVVAVNLLVEFTRRKKLVQYVTKNSAPRAVYESRLTGKYTKSQISNLFKSSGAYFDVDTNIFDVLLVDEAHRLNEKSGMFKNKGENQIKEIMNAAQLSIFFVDNDQMVTFKDIGTDKEIINWANRLQIPNHKLKLSSQFRCNGSDTYLAWLDNCLQIRETADVEINELNYEFGVLDSPSDLRDLILRKNLKNNKSRMVAGYCWDWVSKKTGSQEQCDIVINGYDFAMQWNLSNDGMLWIEKPDSVAQIGCIHTCQGLELDYIGVIIGPDLLYRNGMLKTVPENRARTDQSLKGYKQLLRTNPEYAREKADTIIRNTYKTLMTRGQKGCYVFCTDKETNKYFKELVIAASKHSKLESISDKHGINKYPGLELVVLEKEKVIPYVNSVPIYNLQIAAGYFSDHQIPEEEYDWVQLPSDIKPHTDHFIAQVIGESMNKKIPNGTWCLFNKNPAGSRVGKIVIAQHRSIYDEDHGGQFTIKRYYSEKEPSDDGGWRHSKIVLKPESKLPGYQDIVLSKQDAQDMKILATYVCNL